MRVVLIAVPYDSGRRGERMGAGPEHLLRAGLPNRLAQAGHEVQVRLLEAPAHFRWSSRATVRRPHWHLDLDVLDPEEGRINVYSAPAGLSVVEVEWALAAIAAAWPIQAAALTAFDPAGDPTGRAAEAALRLGVSLVEAATGARAPSP